MEKLACYEAAAARVSQALAEPEAAAPAPANPAPSPASEALVNEATTAAQAPIAADPSPVLAASEAADPAPEAPKRRVLPSWIPSVSLGRSDNKAPESDSFDISVTRIQRNNVDSRRRFHDYGGGFFGAFLGTRYVVDCQYKVTLRQN